jgi:hypothetical protein
MGAAENRNGEAGRFAVRAGFEASPDGQRIENQDAPLHLQEALDANGGFRLIFR